MQVFGDGPGDADPARRTDAGSKAWRGRPVARPPALHGGASFAGRHRTAVAGEFRGPGIVMSRPPTLLLIRGLGHSGTTILDLALGAHPQVKGLGAAARILKTPAPGGEAW